MKGIARNNKGKVQGVIGKLEKKERYEKGFNLSRSFH